MAGIFISYRRDDAGGHAGRLYDRLVEQFGEETVFRDIDSLRPGTDFVSHLEASVERADVVLALIGRDWVSARDATGSQRLMQHDDYVRLELATALREDVPVIPVLIRGTSMPRADELPDEIRQLTRRTAFELPDQHWPFAIAALLQTLEQMLPGELQDKAAISFPEPPVATDAVTNRDAKSGRSFDALWALARSKMKVDGLGSESLAELRRFCAAFDEEGASDEEVVTFARAVNSILILTSNRFVSLEDDREPLRKDVPLRSIERARVSKRYLGYPSIQLIHERVEAFSNSWEARETEVVLVRPRERADEIVTYIQSRGG